MSSPSLEARRLARQEISDSACRRYTEAVGQSSENQRYQNNHLAIQPTSRSEHHSPPRQLISQSRPSINFDLELSDTNTTTRRPAHYSPQSRQISTIRETDADVYDSELPNLERCQPELESMDAMTPEEKISTKRGQFYLNL